MSTPSPEPAAGWYPDPNGANTQRYFDGTAWTDQLAPLNTLAPYRPASSKPAKSPRKFVMLAIGSVVTGFVAFVLMQLAFGAADNGPVWFEVLGFVLFIVFLASAVGAIVGAIGAIVRLVH